MNFIIMPSFILKLQEEKEHFKKKNVSTRLFIVDSQDDQH